MKSITTELSDIIKDLGLYEEFRLEFLRKDFRTLFPPPMGEHLYPSTLKRGQLLIIVDSHVWLNEIRLHKEEMKKRLSGYGVESIRFKLGRVFKKKKGRPVPPAAPGNIPEELIEDVTLKIKDPHIRESLLNAIRSSMRRHPKRIF
ncbi:MAG: DUF721 domain-containing protein [Nitrospirae bacterium]|nr:DUF721 domain-containing protein [Nitrospirota bacterium]